MTKSTGFYTTVSAARELGYHRETINRLCKRYPGFAFRAHGNWRIPAKHVAMLMAGIPAEKIAANVQAVTFGEPHAA